MILASSVMTPNVVCVKGRCLPRATHRVPEREHRRRHPSHAESRFRRVAHPAGGSSATKAATLAKRDRPHRNVPPRSAMAVGPLRAMIHRQHRVYGQSNRVANAMPNPKHAPCLRTACRSAPSLVPHRHHAPPYRSYRRLRRRCRHRTAASVKQHRLAPNRGRHRHRAPHLSAKRQVSAEIGTPAIPDTIAATHASEATNATVDVPEHCTLARFIAILLSSKQECRCRPAQRDSGT